MASFILAYSIENQDTAQKFASDLSTVGAKFQHFIIDEKNDLNTLRAFREPIIAFVSDNFLKSKYCLKGAISIFGDLIKTGQLLVLITAGKQILPDGTVKLIPTQFERVSNVIQYMNFWQDQYLDARKAHNHKEISENELSEVRDISNQIGDFIRQLREANSKTLESAVASNYMQFCLLFGLPQPSQVSDFQFAELVARPTPPPVVTPEEITPSFEPVVTPQIEVIPEIIAPEMAVTNDIIQEVKEEKVEVSEEHIIMPSSAFDEPVEVNPAIEKIEQTTDIQSVVQENNFFDHSKNDQEDDEIEEVLANMPGLDQLNERPKYDNFQKKNIQEIDEDDFFNTGEKDPSSNMNEIIAEVIDEENDDDDDDFSSDESNGNLDDIFDNNTDENDDDDDLFEDIIKGKSIEKKAEESVAAAPSSDTHSDVSETKNEIATEVINSTEEEKIEIAEESIPSENLVEEIPANTHQDTDNQEVTEEENVALGQLKSDVEAEPDNLKTRLRYAVGLAKLQNNWQEATKEVTVVLEKDPTNPSAYFLLGEMSEVNGDFLSAIEYYKKVELFSPYYPNICKKLADLMSTHTQGQDKETKKYFKKAIEIEDDNADLTYAYAAFLLENQKNPEKALKYFKKTLKIDEKHLFANYDVALIYHALGDPYAAQRFYESACSNNAEIKTDDNDNVFKIESILSDERAEEAINSGADDPELTKFSELVDNIEEKESESIDSDLAIAGLGAAATLAVVTPAANLDEPSFADEMISAVNETEVIEVMSSRKDKSKPNPDAKIALITGASSGIGKATAEILAKEGYNLILTGRRKERLVEMEEDFNQNYSGSTIVLAFDVSKNEQVENAIQSLDNEWINIDILLNNAGLGLGLHPIHEGILEHWDTMIDTNIKGLLYMTRMIAPQMVAKRNGHIINICSTAGKETYPNGNVYCATKFAVDALTKSMRIDLHKHNIRVSQVSPGAVNETEFSLVRFEGDKERADKVYDGFTPINANDVAEVIQFIISRPAHVNIQDVLLMSTQQANASIIDRK